MSFESYMSYEPIMRVMSYELQFVSSSSWEHLRIKPFVPSETLIQLYTSLITPYFDYCSEVWCDLNQGISDKLQKMQNRAARISTGATYDIRSADMLKNLRNSASRLFVPRFNTEYGKSSL